MSFKDVDHLEVREKVDKKYSDVIVAANYIRLRLHS